MSCRINEDDREMPAPFSGKIRPTSVDYTGRKFGMLTVLYRAEDAVSRSGKKNQQWACRCDCGTVKSIQTHKFRRGETTSCGCRGRFELAGRRFGRLKAVEFAGMGPNSKALWLCRCDCGTEKVVAANSLKTGRTRSCGCLQVDRQIETHTRETAGVGQAHARVVAAKGKAKEHACVDCGAPACDWSYDGLDPDELVQVGRWDNGRRYSLNVAHYHPRCRTCHRRYDVAMRNGNEVSA